VGTRAFCAPCVSSADCAVGALCLGGANPRCALDCSAGAACPGGLACTGINNGKVMLGRQCVPSDAACGAHTVGEGLSCLDSWANYGAGFFSTTCVGACHRHDAAWTTPAAVRLSADSIRLSIENGGMPQGQTLSAAERTRVLTWLACGAP
jgi:hypothetical protein